MDNTNKYSRNLKDWKALWGIDVIPVEERCLLWMSILKNLYKMKGHTILWGLRDSPRSQMETDYWKDCYSNAFKSVQSGKNKFYSLNKNVITYNTLSVSIASTPSISFIDLFSRYLVECKTISMDRVKIIQLNNKKNSVRLFA